MNFRYPVFLDVSGKRCLVVGEGPEIAAKVRTLYERGALAAYVNPTAEPDIFKLAEAGAVEWHARNFQETDLDGCFLVITSLKDNARIFELAETRSILCNAADDPEHCRFTFGSVVQRGDLSIAISTNGAAPALAVRLRERLEREISDGYGEFVGMLAELRNEITTSLPDFQMRRDLWYRLVDSDALELINKGHFAEAKQLLRTTVNEAITSAKSR